MDDRTSADALIAAARAGEPDRYLTALLAPPAARNGLLALAAFAAEIGRIGHLVTREPAMGEMRLQWWRDAVGQAENLRTGNPVADALGTARARYSLPLDLMIGMIDARACDLVADPFADETQLATYLRGCEGAPFQLAGLVCGAPAGPELVAAAEAAGVCYGRVRLLMNLPRALAQGRLPLPLSRLAQVGLSAAQLTAGGEDIEAPVAELTSAFYADIRRDLATAQRRVANLPRRVRVAFLPLALVGPYLRRLERPGRDPLREVVDIAPLQRICKLAAARLLGRP